MVTVAATPAFRQEIRFARTRDALRIAYAVSGNGYPLVRAGTWMSNIDLDWRLACFGSLYRELARRYRLHRYNPRGYGLSEGVDGEVSLETLVADLEAVVDEARLERFALWGGALAGSVTSIAYAARHPARVSHLVLSAPSARGKMHPGASAEAKERWQAMVKLIELGWGEDNPAFRQIINTQMFPRASAQEMDDLNELLRISTTSRHAARMADASHRADVSGLLPQVRCPTLVLHCRGSAMVPVDEARLVATSIPDTRFVTLDTDNYIPLPTEPAFARMLEEFDAFLPKKAATGVLARLTPREREVLGLVAQGLDNGDIAGHLGMSVKTVRNTVSHIFDKLEVTSRARAIVLARESGLGE